ncbi:MAG: hypothetical protein M1822_000020 [Bathelium mastoideum]|nr:MAG: hypothetical protein M1822_000020 [Bathelium mastoideum]
MLLRATRPLLRAANRTRRHQLPLCMPCQLQRTRSSLIGVALIYSVSKARVQRNLRNFAFRSELHDSAALEEAEESLQSRAIPWPKAGASDLNEEGKASHESGLNPQKDYNVENPIVLSEHSVEDLIQQVDPLVWRDQCQCKYCVDPHSHQKLFQSTDIPSSIRPRRVIKEGDEAHVQWENDIVNYPKDHVTRLTLDRIHELLGSRSPRRPVSWDRSVFMEHHQQWSWPEARGDGRYLYGMLRELDDYGLVFLKEMPALEHDQGMSSVKGVEQIGEEIGPLRNSFYGRTWDVQSVVDAKNIAYTHQHLGLHMDLL